jgi:hypothetical protein
MQDFVLDRDRWLRGEDPLSPTDGGGSFLRRPRDGKMCCLGLYLESRGVPTQALEGVRYPNAVRIQGLIPEDALWCSSTGELAEDFCLVHEEGPTIPNPFGIANINDDYTIPNSHREKAIADAFEKYGVRVIFVDGGEVNK